MRSVTIGFTGRVPSKKNSKKICVNRRTGRRFVKSSDDYDAWENEHVAGLIPHRREFFGARVSVTIAFTYGDGAKNWDLTNKAEGIMDALVLAEVIDDDSVAVVPELTLRYAGVKRGAWRADVTITELR